VSIGKRMRTERRAEFQRACALNAPVVRGPDGEDHGLDLGPAALARPARLERVDGKLRGAGQRMATPVYARMIDCVDLFSRLNQSGQLTDRQCKAGLRMLALKRAAGLEPRVTAKHTIVREEDDQPPVLDEVEVAEDICPPGYDPRTWYRHLLRQLASQSADLVDQACDWDPERKVGRVPTALLATFQSALDRIADLLLFKREGIGV
jgi:hypothetical protein